MNLSPRWPRRACGQVAGLVRPHRDLRVPSAIHRPLVDVGRANDYVFIINYKRKQKNKKNKKKKKSQTFEIGVTYQL